MQTIPTSPNRVELPFVCPICAGANAVHLVSLSRASGMACAHCKKWLRSADVMRAMHSPRAARPGAESVPVHVEGSSTEPEAPPRTRAPPTRPSAMTWPPTPESRAAVKPLYKRKGDGHL